MKNFYELGLIALVAVTGCVGFAEGAYDGVDGDAPDDVAPADAPSDGRAGRADARGAADASVADTPAGDAPAADAACAPGATLCGARCVRTSVNPTHCGACGNACPEGQSCVAGRCGQ